MTWTQIGAGVFLCLYMLWHFWRTEHQFKAGYRMALDHVEEMTRTRGLLRPALSVDEAIRKLREERR